MIILIGSEKGGVGKSTMATNISVYLSLQDKDVILVDADRQGTSSVWADDRDKTELKQIESVSKFGNIRPTLEALQARYEYVVVDSQGRDSEELRTGLMAADLCITPVRPSQADLDTIYKIEYLVDTAKSFNQKLETLCIITQAPNTSTEIRDAQLALSAYERINTIKSIVYERRIYRDALGSGHGVLEMKDTKAVQEMNAVCQEIFKW